MLLEAEPELAAAIKEYDEMKRELEGEQPRGKHHSLSNFDNEGWSQKRTAKDLGIKQSQVAEAIRIAKAVEEEIEDGDTEDGKGEKSKRQGLQV